MIRPRLGEFEELVLMIVAIKHQDAYGVSVMDEILEKTGRKINISAVHTALDRLEQKKYLKSWIGGATKERGGRSKRFFDITAEGVAALEINRQLRNELFDLIPESVFQKK
ncbi:MAG: PadR family transcriptional regulator [Cyclobacteriaceae bacterium]|nr:PadR family transcriptional regulator [Cyclobacteriaceae bacterium HetDA_MAG_MS6]